MWVGVIHKLQMAYATHEFVNAHGIFVLMAIVYMLSQQVVEGRNVLVDKYLDLKHNGTVKTIVSEEDVIDCVDFYQQPAFDDPLIKKNFQMMPTSYPSEMQSNSTRPKLTQPWHKHGECPKGTIPIRRSSRHHNHKDFQLLESNAIRHEYVTAAVDHGQYYGGQAFINVWNPRTEPNELSLSQLWLLSGVSGDVNSIEAGWMVYPNRYGSSETRFFIYWTSDNYQRTGCYDLDCTGFVQTDTSFIIGGAITPVSTYDGETFDISIAIKKDPVHGHWWLAVEGATLGYWPKTLFNHLATFAKSVSWGGEIAYSTQRVSHTTTQMGSGHFSSEGYGKSSYFRDIATLDIWGHRHYPDPLNTYMTNPACYDIQLHPTRLDYFYYGGPGFSANCR